MAILWTAPFQVKADEGYFDEGVMVNNQTHTIAVVETTGDLASVKNALGAETGAGSLALCTADGKRYVKKSDETWVSIDG